MIYTALVIAFLMLCVAAGGWGGMRMTHPRVLGAFATVMVMTQLALLLTR